MPSPDPETHAAPTDETLITVTLTAARWKRVETCLDWHGKDHESELIVDSIREQISDAS